MATVKREALLQAIRKVLAANLACHEDDFTKDGTFISVVEFREGRMQFPLREKSLSIITMGKA
jgi:hypothetical protein